MALSQATVKRIQKAIEHFRLYLKYTTLGPHKLTASELKSLVRSGYIGQHANPRAAIGDAYMTTHLHTTAQPAKALKTIREGSLQYLENMAELYSDKAAESLGADVMSAIESYFLPFVNRKEGKMVYDVLKDPKSKGKYLGTILKDKVDNWEHRYQMIAVTETNRAANFGAMDAILHNNKTKSPEEIYVYKTGIHDRAQSCPDCQKFWFMEDGRPRVYKLSELIENGTNIGRKRADWKATVDASHVFCVHYLQELKPGFGFKSGEGLDYIGKDWNEFNQQRGKK